MAAAEHSADVLEHEELVAATLAVRRAGQRALEAGRIERAQALAIAGNAVERLAAPCEARRCPPQTTEIPWLTRPPTAEEVAAHAKAYPAPRKHEFCEPGEWLVITEYGPAFVRLHVADDRWDSADDGTRMGFLRIPTDIIRWLPCTAEGIPVCFVDGAYGAAPPLRGAARR